MFFVHLRLLSRATTGYARSLQALAVTGGAATGSLRARNAILSPESKAPNTQAFHSSSRSSDKKRPIDPLVQYWDPPSTYPSGWIDGHHNEDYAIVGSPLEPQHIMHFYESEGQMYFRISFKIQEGMYLPMTFLVQTGAAHSMYLCLEAKQLLEHHGRLRPDDRLQIQGPLTFKMRDIPNDRTTNIIGMQLIREFGIHIGNGQWNWATTQEYW